MLTILHASDVHFGRPHSAPAAEALLRAVGRLSPDLIVFSGDFTQRAKVREFEAARDFLAKVSGVPTVVTLGNHDIPVYRVFERLLAPRRNYRAYISDALDTVTRVEGATVVALDSTSPYTAIVNGRISRRQIAFARAQFDAAPADQARIVVLHHALAPAPDFEEDEVLPASGVIMEAFEAMGVELILSGHLHRAYVTSSHDILPLPPTVWPVAVVHSGTTTSRRGRARERGRNTFNLVRLHREHLEIVHHIHGLESGEFEPFEVRVVPRRTIHSLPAGAWTRPPPP